MFTTRTFLSEMNFFGIFGLENDRRCRVILCHFAPFQFSENINPNTPQKMDNHQPFRVSSCQLLLFRLIYSVVWFKFLVMKHLICYTTIIRLFYVIFACINTLVSFIVLFICYPRHIEQSIQCIISIYWWYIHNCIVFILIFRVVDIMLIDEPLINHIKDW